jgi:hypothetical protein
MRVKTGPSRSGSVNAAACVRDLCSRTARKAPEFCSARWSSRDPTFSAIATLRLLATTEVCTGSKGGHEMDALGPSLTRPLYLLELTDLTQPFTPQFAALD